MRVFLARIEKVQTYEVVVMMEDDRSPEAFTGASWAAMVNNEEEGNRTVMKVDERHRLRTLYELGTNNEPPIVDVKV